MHGLIVLASAAVSAGIDVPKGPLAPPSVAQIVGTVPLAQRARGASVVDQAGAAPGVVDQSDANMVIVLVGDRKVQLPAAAFHAVAGRLTLALTRRQFEQMSATSALFQAQTRPAPLAVPPPMGITQLPAITPTTAGGVAAHANIRAAAASTP